MDEVQKRLELVDLLLNECESNQEKLKVVQTARIFVNDLEKQQKLLVEEHYFISEIKKEKKKEEKRGNPNFKKEITLEEEIFEVEFVEKGIELLKSEPHKYLPKKKTAVLSNELKGALLAEYEDQVSESKAHRFFEKHSTWVWREILKLRKKLETDSDKNQS